MPTIFFAAGGTADQLREIAETAKEYEPMRMNVGIYQFKCFAFGF
jgi:hypothetical protein